MCLTLANAAAVIDHRCPPPPARSYTRTRHHAGHLTPGDVWRPDPDQQLRTVTAIHHHHGHIALTDQYGATYTYPADGLIPTAVPDPLVSTRGLLRRVS